MQLPELRLFAPRSLPVGFLAGGYRCTWPGAMAVDVEGLTPRRKRGIICSHHFLEVDQCVISRFPGLRHHLRSRLSKRDRVDACAHVVSINQDHRSAVYINPPLGSSLIHPSSAIVNNSQEKKVWTGHTCCLGGMSASGRRWVRLPYAKESLISDACSDFRIVPQLETLESLASGNFLRLISLVGRNYHPPSFIIQSLMMHHSSDVCMQLNYDWCRPKPKTRVVIDLSPCR